MTDQSDPAAYRVEADKPASGLKKLLPFLILALLLIALAIYLLARHSSTTTPASAPTPTASTSQSTPSISAKFQQNVDEGSRTFYFKPDVADYQDATVVDTGVARIVAFYKANNGAKLSVNGSVFDGQAGGTANPLAQQRAQLIKQKLVDAGVTANDVQVTAINTYQGNTDAAKAEYARSVSVTAK